MAYTGVFAGLDQATLQTSLTQAQQALITLAAGNQVATVSYAQGEGNRSVTYNRGDTDKLRAVIKDLQAALGIRSRRAVHVSFL